MERILGEFSDEPLNDHEYLTFGFMPSLIHNEQQRWQKNGLLADLLADYVTIFFLSHTIDFNSFKKQNKIKGIISYIANELLQNAMQYHDEAFDDIGVKLQLRSDHIVLYVTNSISVRQIEDFQSFIQQLLHSDLEELYSQVIEDEDTISGLGLLTIIMDYGAKLGWKFETIQTEPEIIRVTTMVQLELVI